MSVRTMTTDQIKKDIQVTQQQWPGGIPVEQEDRMKALYGELKRRGQDAPPRLAPEPQLALADMTEEGLERELKRVAERIGREPGNEELQNRFADVRFEMKNRMKPASTVARREIEFDVETVAQEAKDGGQVAVAVKQTNGSSKQELFPGMLKAEERANKLVLAQVAAKVAGELLTAQLNGMISQLNGDDIETACDAGLAIAKAIFTRLGVGTE